MARVAIMGYGVEGQAAAKYWAKAGHEVTVCDVKADLDLPPGYQAKLGADYLQDLGKFDVIVRSPGIRPDKITAANPSTPDLLNRITSSTREFFAQCPAPIIGVTGTKGKGTTATLVAKILEAAGRTVWLGGNIGRSPLEFLAKIKPDELVVLELSSFQLMDLQQSPAVAVCLMIAPEHMDWHYDFEEYVTAKQQLFAHQKPGDLAIFKAGDANSRTVALASSGTLVPYGQIPGAAVHDRAVMMGDMKICDVNEVGLLGAHNLENVCAAITATWELTGHNAKATRQAVTHFTGLEHRLELVREVAGVRYYDDSFSTTPETATAAIKTFKEPKVIILGGSSKGAVYDGLAAAVEDGGVIHALLIGDTAPEIAKALQRAGFAHFTVGFTTMADLLEMCYHITEPGDVVLLSPACASFGLFVNYKERGSQFRAAVLSLAERVASAAQK